MRLVIESIILKFNAILDSYQQLPKPITATVKKEALCGGYRLFMKGTRLHNVRNSSKTPHSDSERMQREQATASFVVRGDEAVFHETGPAI